MKKSDLLRFMNFWPPYIGSGVRVKRIAPDLRSIEVEMKLRFWNQNYVGTHFGGSLYAMTDPFYMLMLIENLGKNYVVWDKAAHIKFKSPGRGKVHTRFDLDVSQIAAIKAEADEKGRAEPHFIVRILNEDNELVAEVEKVLSVKTKESATSPTASHSNRNNG